jgi:hypothetical protein
MINPCIYKGLAIFARLAEALPKEIKSGKLTSPEEKTVVKLRFEKLKDRR